MSVILLRFTALFNGLIQAETGRRQLDDLLPAATRMVAVPGGHAMESAQTVDASDTSESDISAVEFEPMSDSYLAEAGSWVQIS